MKKIKEKTINGWDVWSRNFYNAKRFFESKGNVKTKARLKAKWYNDFEEGIKKLIRIK